MKFETTRRMATSAGPTGTFPGVGYNISFEFGNRPVGVF